MPIPIYPSLWFDGNASEAANFYCKVFQNAKILTEINPVVSFELNGNKLIAINGGPMFKLNPSISLFVNCNSLEETNRIWTALIEKGSFLIPIDKYDWSERYGWLIDRFGLSWQISYTGAQHNNLRILPSLLFTQNNFGKAYEAIQFYTQIFKDSTTNILEFYPEKDSIIKNVLYSEFSLNGTKLIAMDGPGEHDFNFNEAISFVVECENQTEIDYYWENLVRGGEESMCGWLKDKFGISWQIIPKILVGLLADPVTADFAKNAFLKMKKFEIDKLSQK